MFFRKIFNRLDRSKQAIHTPLEKIPWNDIIRECYDTGLNFTCPVIKVIYTDDKTERVVILQTLEMLCRIIFEKLHPFSDDELQYISSGLHGFWCPAGDGGSSFFDTEKRAIDEIYSTPPFKYNKSIVWVATPFRIDAESPYWIKNDGEDDPDDLCLHGHVFVKIGDDIFDYNATLSAAGLYLLRTLTDNHIVHVGEAMLPCCGHMMVANDDLNSVDICGCPNGLDWSVIHKDGGIKLVTEAGKETFISMGDYKAEVYAFTDKLEAYYQKCLPKNMPSEEFERNGYTAFWNEWNRRKE